MKKKVKKLFLQQKKRALNKIVGNSEKPRLSVFRSHKHIYAQLIDDKIGHTLTFSSTLEKNLITNDICAATQQAAYLVGQRIALKANERNIKTVVFDRGNRPYHGRIQKVAEGAREKGLIF